MGSRLATVSSVNLGYLTDGEILWVAICLHGRCVRRLREMVEAADPPNASLLRRLLRDEVAHLMRLRFRWGLEGSPELPEPELLAWLDRRFPEATRGRRAAAVQLAARRFHREAMRAAVSPAVTALLGRIASDEKRGSGRPHRKLSA